MKDSKDNIEANENDTREMYAYYLIGRAMLDKIGLPDGIDPVEAAKELISLWGKREESSKKPEQAPVPADGVRSNENEIDFKQLPRPIRGGLSEAPAIDFDNMSTEQFRRLKNQLQNAARNGKRIRI